MQNTRNYAYGSDYEFSVRVKGKKVPEHYFNDEYFIEGRKGSEYELYFQNKTSKRVMVVMSVDGLSVMDGKTASEKSDGYVVEAYRDLVVPGWRINSNKSAKFQFRPQDDKANTTYVELLLEEGFDVDASNQGVIGCMVFEEVEKPLPKTEYVHHYHNYYNPFYWNKIQQPYGDPWLNKVAINGVMTSQAIQGQSYNGPVAGSVSAVNLDNNSGYGLRSAGLSKGLVGANPTVAQAMNLSGTVSPGYVNFVETSTVSMNEKITTPSLGTGFGDDIRFETKTVKFDPKPDPSWIGVINYDTVQGLRKRGIFITKSTNSKAFPAYKEKGCYVPNRR